MSKAKNDIPRAAIHVGAPAKSFSLAEGNEPERREWDETTYRLKNQDKNNLLSEATQLRDQQQGTDSATRLKSCATS